jgi:cytochrome P450
MGVRRNTYTPEGVEYSRAVNNANLMFFERLVNPLWLADFVYYRTNHGKKYLGYSNMIRDFITSLVYQRKYEIGLEMSKGTFDEKKPKGVMDTLVHKLIKNEPGVDERFVVEEVTTIVFDGHETTGWGMVWALYLLGQNPDAQRKLQEEVDEVFGDDPDKELTADDICKLKYTDMVIKEAQRIIPSVPIIARRVLQETDVDGHIVPVGTNLGVLTYQIHRDQRFWPEPEKFQPERFEPENSVGRHGYAHIPFSAGPRNCLGQKFAYNEEKIVLAHIFRNFNVTSEIAYEKLQVNPAIISRHLDPLPVRLEPRV